MSNRPDTPPLRILHLFANFKWTGPADPAIRLAAHQRDLGLDVRFAQAEWVIEGGDHRIARKLRAARIPVVSGLELRKHFRVRSTVRDARALRQRLRCDPVDVVHTHLPADHLIAATALRTLGASRPRLVRTLYDPEPPRRGWRERVAFGVTDGVIAPTSSCRQMLIERYGFDDRTVLHQDPPTERPPAGVVDRRAELGLGPDHFAIGVNSRFQPHRRFRLLWDAARRVVDARPSVRFVVLGRGNERDTEALIREPIRRAGLEREIILTGYLREPEYSRTLASFDAFAFLVPGSDGTCRALRESMSFGVPAVVSQRGMLPYLVGDAGIVVDDDPEQLASALVRLVDDEDLRGRMAAAARARVTGPMDPVAAARRVVGLYGALVP